MYSVRQILREKGGQVWTVSPDETVFNALTLMAKRGIGALVVTSQGQAEGMLSERDYARKIILLNRSSKTTAVHEIMTSPVVTCTPDWGADDCMRIMTERRFRHLPVIDSGRLAGIVSIGDVVKAIIDGQHFELENLARYLNVAPP